MKLYDVHGPNCPSDCLIKATEEEVLEDFDFIENLAEHLRSLKKGQVHSPGLGLKFYCRRESREPS